MSTITAYGIKEYSRKHNSDVLNLLIDIGLLTPTKMRTNRKLEFYDAEHRLWVTRQKTSKENYTYRAYKTMPRIKEPTEDKAVMLLEVIVTPSTFEVRDFTRGEWENTLKEIVAINNLGD